MKAAGGSRWLLLFLLLSTVPVFPFGKNKVNFKPYSWRTLDSAHCRIYFHKPQEATAGKALHYAQLLVLEYQKKLKHDLTRSIPIILFPSHPGFEENNLTQGSIGEQTGGFTELLRCRIVLPFEGDWDKFRRILAHEMVHAFQFDILFGRRDNPFGRLIVRTPPLWFLEGMAEYLSLGWDSKTESIIRDAVLKNSLPDMDALTRLRIHPKQYLLVYKQGQAFLHYLTRRYGNGVVSTLLSTFQRLHDPERVFKEVCGTGLKELSRDFLTFMKKRYYPHISSYSGRDDRKVKLSNHLKDGSSMNLLPSISPDGKYYAYLSNRDFFPSILLADFTTGKILERVAISWREGRYTGFLFDGNRISWSPDASKLAFLTRTASGYALSVHSVPSGKRVLFRQLPDETSAGPLFTTSGSGIYVLSYRNGTTEMKRFPISGGESVSMLRHDEYLDNPRRLKSRGILLREKKGKKTRLLLFKPDARTIHGFPLTEKDTIMAFDIKKDILVYLKERAGQLDIWMLSLKTGKKSRLTRSSGFAGPPAIHPDEKQILYSEYSMHGYDIVRLKTEPLTSRRQPLPGLWLTGKLNEYDFSAAAFKGLLKKAQPADYEPALIFDLINGIVGFNSQAGIRLIGRMSMSDMLGDHRLTLTLDTAVATSSDTSSSLNAILNYYLLKGRSDLIASLFHYRSAMFFYDFQMILNNAFVPLPDEKRAGGYLLFRQPFSRFSRLDISWTSMHFKKYYVDLSDNRSANLHILQLLYSFDNTVWGLFGPMDGVRFRASVGNAFNLWGKDWQFQQLEVDFRAYLRFFKRYALAFRLNGGIVRGKHSSFNLYEMGGFYTIRGFPFFSIRGDTMLLSNLELRFPFIDLLALGFPIPLKIARIRGVIFCDAGAAWDKGKQPVFWRRNSEGFRFVDLRLSYGVGFRFLLGPFRIRWDFAAPYDGKGPRSLERWLGMFSLGMDF